MHWLLYLDVIRGEHSTGVCAVHDKQGKHEVSVYKEVGRPEELYDTYEDVFKNDIYQPVMPLLLMGHNRHATQGTIEKDTAHPFEYDNIVGAHNGTVLQSSLSTLNGYKEWNIDSQILFQHVNDTGSIQEVWDKADGAMALTWWDKNQKALKIVRNDQRSLYWTVSKDGRTLFWASLPWMLSVALSKANIKHEEIKSFPTDTLFTISLDKNRKVKATEEKLNPFVKVVGFTGYTGGYSGYSYQQNQGKKSWLKLTEFVKEGQEDHQGYFVGQIEGDPKEEVIIKIDGATPLVQKNRYDRIMSFWKERDSIGQNAIYSFCEWDLDIEHSYWVLLEYMITRTYGGTPAKTIAQNTIQIDGEFLDKKQFEQKYTEGCCLCGTCVPFEKAKTSLFIKDNLICEECKEEDMVKEWIKMNEEEAA